MFDQRLFNQSAGMVPSSIPVLCLFHLDSVYTHLKLILIKDSGFSGGNDEKVAVYDKPLFADRRQVLSPSFQNGVLLGICLCMYLAEVNATTLYYSGPWTRFVIASAKVLRCFLRLVKGV